MSTTNTLKLPQELKQRIAAAATDAGKSPHAFMVEALAAQTALFAPETLSFQATGGIMQRIRALGCAR
jgi:predicted transcriptional regulator